MNPSLLAKARRPVSCRPCKGVQQWQSNLQRPPPICQCPPSLIPRQNHQ
jgi:hypothetical protein